MKKIVYLICITLFFSCTEEIDDIARNIYDNNVDQPRTYGIYPPSTIHGTWMADDENATIKGFKFESRDFFIISASTTEGFSTIISNNPNLRIDDFYQTWSNNYYKIYQEIQGGNKLWYEFKKESQTELIWTEYPSVKYKKQ